MKLTDKEYQKLHNEVYSYPTKNKAGFVSNELMAFILKYENLNMEKFWDALKGNTCAVDNDGQAIIYHCDILTALLCGLENRNINQIEWD